MDPTPVVSPTLTLTVSYTNNYTHANMGGYLTTATASQKSNGDIIVTYTGGPAADLVVGITVIKAGSAANVPILCALRRYVSRW